MPKSYYVYLLDCIDHPSRKVYRRGKYHLKQQYWHKRFFYTGLTTNPIRRYLQHLYGVKSHFLQNNASRARKRMVYVEELPTYAEALKREVKVKKMGTQEKKDLIASSKNQLISLNLDKRMIVLRKLNHDGEYISGVEIKGGVAS